MQRGDTFVLVLVVIFFSGWIWYGLRRWLAIPRAREEWRIEPDGEIPVTEAVELLEHAGYEVMTQKRKVPVHIKVDDSEEHASRLFIDHFARDEEGIYVVKIMKDERPIEWTGNGLRDHLLVYHLLYPDAVGILVVDTEEEIINKVQFTMLGESL